MERDYDLFEVLPDGAAIWKEAVSGHENAIRKLVELSKRTTNEVRVMHMLSNTLIASMKGTKT
jgi:prophage DNA circulation protein